LSTYKNINYIDLGDIYMNTKNESIPLS